MESCPHENQEQNECSLGYGSHFPREYTTPEMPIVSEKVLAKRHERHRFSDEGEPV